MKIAVSGLGYVGLSNAVLLAQHNEVVAYDIAASKIEMINNQQSPIVDAEIQDYLKKNKLKLKAVNDKETAYQGADYVIIATPTNYNAETNFFDTSSVQTVIHDVLSIAPKAAVVIKSTIPVGFVDQMREKFALI
jgi:UDPglucose 6-dehydrogenase